MLSSVTWCVVCCSRKFPVLIDSSIYLPVKTASVMSFWSVSVFFVFIYFFFPAVDLKLFRFGALMDFYSQVLDVPYICISLWIYVCMWLSLCIHNFLFTWRKKKSNFKPMLVVVTCEKCCWLICVSITCYISQTLAFLPLSDLFWKALFLLIHTPDATVFSGCLNSPLKTCQSLLYSYYVQLTEKWYLCAMSLHGMIFFFLFC